MAPASAFADGFRLRPPVPCEVAEDAVSWGRELELHASAGGPVFYDDDQFYGRLGVIHASAEGSWWLVEGCGDTGRIRGWVDHLTGPHNGPVVLDGIVGGGLGLDACSAGTVLELPCGTALLDGPGGTDPEHTAMQFLWETAYMWAASFAVQGWLLTPLCPRDVRDADPWKPQLELWRVGAQAVLRWEGDDTWVEVFVGGES